jgi:hypothetical protein
MTLLKGPDFPRLWLAPRWSKTHPFYKNYLLCGYFELTSLVLLELPEESKLLTLTFPETFTGALYNGD